MSEIGKEGKYITKQKMKRLETIVLTPEEQEALDREMDNTLLPVWLARHAITCWWNDVPLKGGALNMDKLSEALRMAAGSYVPPKQ